MAIRYRLSSLFVLATLIFASTAALAAPMEATISLGRDPEPPVCVANPGGVVTITWNIEHTTTPNYVYYKLEDPTRTIILEDSTYAGSSGINISRQWTVPVGSVDGKYWVRVEYWSFEAGNEANAEVTFYVCTNSGSLVVLKLEDVDRDGGCVDDDSPLQDWQICIDTPLGDTYCKQTDATGQARWDGMPYGLYTVYEVVEPGWSSVDPESLFVTLSDSVFVTAFCNVRTGNKGACCGPWGSSACTQAYESWCVEQGGIFMGIGTACGNGICATSVEPRSWGRIKAMYR
jgi:hypothetical protein